MWDLADTLLGSWQSIFHDLFLERCLHTSRICLIMSSMSVPKTARSLSSSMSLLVSAVICLAPGLTVIVKPDLWLKPLIPSTERELVKGAGDKGLNSWANVILSQSLRFNKGYHQCSSCQLEVCISLCQVWLFDLLPFLTHCLVYHLFHLLTLLSSKPAPWKIKRVRKWKKNNMSSYFNKIPNSSPL